MIVNSSVARRRIIDSPPRSATVCNIYSGRQYTDKPLIDRTDETLPNRHSAPREEVTNGGMTRSLTDGNTNLDNSDCGTPNDEHRSTLETVTRGTGDDMYRVIRTVRQRAGHQLKLMELIQTTVTTKRQRGLGGLN